MSTSVNYIHGNIFTSEHQTLVNTVNCVGIMGAGIALEFKYRYPEMFTRYAQLCKDGKMQIGSLYIYDVVSSQKKVLNFPTKAHWKAPSKYEYLEKGLKKFVETYREKNITSVAFPLLGAQNGRLDPEQVKAIMFDYLHNCDIPITIYEYAADAPDDLYQVFIKGLHHNRKEFEKTTELSASAVNKLKDQLAGHDLNSLIQLVKIKGIGEETIKACFRFAMKHKRTLVLEQEIFSTPLSTNSYTPYISDSAGQIPLTNTLQESNHHYETGGVNELDQSKGTTTTKLHATEAKKGSTTKKNTNKQVTKKIGALSIASKQLCTNLPETTILKIEAKDESVTIAEIKAYCEGMKLSLKKFLTSQYTS